MTLEEFLKEVNGKEEDIVTYSGSEALAAVNEDGYALRYVKEQTEEICLAAVNEDGYALQHVKEQNLEVCLAAVNEDGYALQHVKEQNLEVCLAAVKRNGHALQYVKEQNLEICLAAVNEDGYALQYVDKSIFDKIKNNDEKLFDDKIDDLYRGLEILSKTIKVVEEKLQMQINTISGSK